MVGVLARRIFRIAPEYTCLEVNVMMAYGMLNPGKHAKPEVELEPPRRSELPSRLAYSTSARAHNYNFVTLTFSSH